MDFQNDVSAAKGIAPAAPSNFKPVIKKSVTYIVAAVLVNEHGDVLMMQVREKFLDSQFNLTTVKFGYFELGYNEQSVITNTRS